MKQYITTKQLNELSEKGKKKLRKWWKPLGNDYLYSPEYEMAEKTGKWSVGISCDEWAKDWHKEKMQKFEWVKETLPLLSIGQMVEFLDENKAMRYSDLGTITFGFEAENLCDDLWEDVKEVLEK